MVSREEQVISATGQFSDPVGGLLAVIGSNTVNRPLSPSW